MTDPQPENIAPVYHGAFDYAELRRLGLSPDDVLDFSVNSNPYGPPPGVRQALASVPLARYPDRECIALREKIAEVWRGRWPTLKITPGQVLFGNGTAELFHLIAYALIPSGSSVLVIMPTFGEYVRVARLAGAHIVTYQAHPPDFAIDWTDVAGLIKRQQIQTVFLCSPNNPTGRVLAGSQIFDLVASLPETLFIWDNAYVDFLPESQLPDLTPFMARQASNLVVVYSLTKQYSLAGLRLGALFGARRVVDEVRQVRPAWNVNGFAQAAGLAALDADTWLPTTIPRLHQHKQDLLAGLQKRGYTPLHSDVHYFLVPVGDGAAFRVRLLQHKVMVRDCASFGLPGYVRIATRTPDDNAALLAALDASTT